MNDIMETANSYPVATFDITMDDSNVMPYIKTLLKQLKGVRSVRVVQKPTVEIPKEDYLAAIEESAKQIEEGKCVSMKTDESGEDFIKRLLCTK